MVGGTGLKHWYAILKWSALLLAFAIVAILLWIRRSHSASIVSTLTALDRVNFYQEDYLSKKDVWNTEETTIPIFSGLTILRHGQNTLTTSRTPKGKVNEQWMIGGEDTGYYPDDNCAVRFRSSDDGMEPPPMDLKEFGRLTGMGPAQESKGETWHGRAANRFEWEKAVDRQYGQVEQGTTTLFVDASTFLPLEWTTKEKMHTTSSQFDYAPADSRGFSITLPKGTPLYDLDEQRAELQRRVAIPMAEAKVGGKTIALRALVVDRYGDLRAWTTGGAGAPAGTNHLVRADGLKSVLPERRAPALAGPRVRPRVFKGLQLSVHDQLFARNTVFPPRITVRVPVWSETQESPIGWAVFPNVAPVKTWSVSFLTELGRSDIFYSHD
jgi:hypothetical protein